MPPGKEAIPCYLIIWPQQVADDPQVTLWAAQDFGTHLDAYALPREAWQSSLRRLKDAYPVSESGLWQAMEALLRGEPALEEIDCQAENLLRAGFAQTSSLPRNLQERLLRQREPVQAKTVAQHSKAERTDQFPRANATDELSLLHSQKYSGPRIAPRVLSNLEGHSI